jgi:hypothetical protein
MCRMKDRRDWRLSVNWPEFDSFDLARDSSQPKLPFSTAPITPTGRNGATLSVGNLLASLSLEPVMKTAAVGVLHRVMIAICIVLTLAFGVSCLCASRMMKLSTVRHISAPFASTRD